VKAIVKHHEVTTTSVNCICTAAVSTYC